MLSFLHIFLIASSNILVQYPFDIWGFHTTYGAFTYPFIFILSDLATRLYGAKAARKIVYKAMIPALLVSFLLTMMSHKNISAMGFISRISLACFIAYVVGQLLDIYVFSKFSQSNKWYLGPLLSGTLSNTVDTFLFFSLAFYHSSNHFMAANWLSIAYTDLVFKCLISTIAFIPVYGLLLKIAQLHMMPSFNRHQGEVTTHGQANL